MNYKEFEEMMIELYLKEIEYNKKLWLFSLDFMEKWKPSELPAKGEDNDR